VFAIIYDRQICTWTLCFKDFCRLVYPASLLHNPYLLLCQPVKPGPASICPSVASMRRSSAVFS
ncbi:MAG: hypothetical protein WCW68_12855, partial [Methanothrix sp.]